MIAETVSRNVRVIKSRRGDTQGTLGHDLPLLAATLAPTVRLDWAALIASGITPSLPLGAERRLRGPR